MTIETETEQKTPIKIAYVGGGSRSWARKLMTDLALTPGLAGEIVLYDIDFGAAQRNVRLSNKIFGHPQACTSFKVRAVSTLPQALSGADFVVLSIQPGPLQMFANDLDIPAKYGIIQPVGDSTGPGGISRALRSVPIYRDFAHAIMQHCPKAWVINYTNPMTLCTAALYAAEPSIKAFGCCHEVFGAGRECARIAEEFITGSKLHRTEVAYDVSGVNHFTFLSEASYRGKDLFPLFRRKMGESGFFDDQTKVALWRKENRKWGNSSKKIAYDFFRRFGVYGGAGDRHLSEFVPWYLSSEEALHRWGVILTPSSSRLAHYDEKAESLETLKRSDEEGVQQILALIGNTPLDSNVNLPNRGQIPELPAGAVVETMAQFRHNSLKPVTARPLPAGAMALVKRVVEVQQMTLQAALASDKEMAFQAVLNDPLCTIATDKAWEMLDELLTANREMLPGWKFPGKSAVKRSCPVAEMPLASGPSLRFGSDSG